MLNPATESEAYRSRKQETYKRKTRLLNSISWLKQKYLGNGISWSKQTA